MRVILDDAIEKGDGEVKKRRLGMGYVEGKQWLWLAVLPVIFDDADDVALGFDAGTTH